jgi:hypothetical protein
LGNSFYYDSNGDYHFYGPSNGESWFFDHNTDEWTGHDNEGNSWYYDTTGLMRYWDSNGNWYQKNPDTTEYYYELESDG